MFERFTDRARRVVVLAQEEAERLGHGHIGTEHLLLALLREGDGLAAKALKALGLSLDAVRQATEAAAGPGGQARPGHLPFTPRAKKVLELSLRESLALGHDYIGTEHILLGLVREGEGAAAQVLAKEGAELGRVRQQVIQLTEAPGRPRRAGIRLGGPGAVSELAARLDAVIARLEAVERQLGIRPARQQSPGAAGPGREPPGAGAEPGTPGESGEPGDRGEPGTPGGAAAE
jgi:ATP-dependent Clp protease ATP-binding subunit ClpA